MKVILLQDVQKLGRKYDIKEVANGYARNFLIPHGLVALATDEEIDKIEELKEFEIQQAEEELNYYQDLANQIDGMEIEIPAKVSEEGKLFGAITAKHISDKLKEMGHKVDEKQIKLKEPIKETGEYDVDIQLPHNLEVRIKVIIKEAK